MSSTPYDQIFIAKQVLKETQNIRPKDGKARICDAISKLHQQIDALRSTIESLEITQERFRDDSGADAHRLLIEASSKSRKTRLLLEEITARADCYTDMANKCGFALGASSSFHHTDNDSDFKHTTAAFSKITRGAALNKISEWYERLGASFSSPDAEFLKEKARSYDIIPHPVAFQPYVHQDVNAQGSSGPSSGRESSRHGRRTGSIVSDQRSNRHTTGSLHDPAASSILRTSSLGSGVGYLNNTETAYNIRFDSSATSIYRCPITVRTDYEELDMEQKLKEELKRKRREDPLAIQRKHVVGTSQNLSSRPKLQLNPATAAELDEQDRFEIEEKDFFRQHGYVYDNYSSANKTTSYRLNPRWTPQPRSSHGRIRYPIPDLSRRNNSSRLQPRSNLSQSRKSYNNGPSRPFPSSHSHFGNGLDRDRRRMPYSNWR